MERGRCVMYRRLCEGQSPSRSLVAPQSSAAPTPFSSLTAPPPLGMCGDELGPWLCLGSAFLTHPSTLLSSCRFSPAPALLFQPSWPFGGPALHPCCSCEAFLAPSRFAASGLACALCLWALVASLSAPLSLYPISILSASSASWLMPMRLCVR